MNFIFDIGNVLVHYKPTVFLREFLNNEAHEQKMMDTIFNSPEWIMLDAATITQDEACRLFCQREPEYKDMIINVMENMHKMLTPMEETIALLPKIKEQGHTLYFLSNYHTKLSAYILEKYSFFSLFDGGVFSCQVNMVKPDIKIYQHLLNKYSLDPAECVFFDDTQKNAAAANDAGITGVLFSDAADVVKYI